MKDSPPGESSTLQRDIAFGLLHQAGADDAARHLVAFGAGERRIVDEEGHRQSRRIDRLRLQGLDDFGHAERVGDVEFLEPGDGDDIARLRFFDRRPLDAAEGQDLRHAALLDDIALAVEDFHRLVRLDAAGKDAAGDDAAEIGIGFEKRAEHAEGALFDLRRRHMPQHEIEERRHALLRPVRALGHPALLGGAVENRKIELLFGRIERGEEIEDLVHDFSDAGIGLVDLVDRDDRLQADLQRLADHEFGLRHRPFRGIDEDDGAIDHGENALHLAAEIGMAGRIDDIDAALLPGDRGRLGHDGDAALLFEIVRIHDALGDALIFTKGAGLLQQTIDERRLAVVDMGDDGDIAQIHENPGSNVQSRLPTQAALGVSRRWSFGERLFLRMSRAKAPLRGRTLSYMVWPLRNCSIPYLNPTDLETGEVRANQPRPGA